MAQPTALAALIESKLQGALGADTVVVVEDDSAAHAGHGASGAHVNLTVTSASFAGKGPVQRHRMIYAALAEEMTGPIHALAIVAKTPD
jgi:BolA protein